MRTEIGIGKFKAKKRHPKVFSSLFGGRNNLNRACKLLINKGFNRFDFTLEYFLCAKYLILLITDKTTA